MTSFTKGEGGSQFCSTMDEALKNQTIKFDRGREVGGGQKIVTSLMNNPFSKMKFSANFS